MAQVPTTFQFNALSVSIPAGAVWPINKPWEVEFNQQVDLTTVIAGSTVQLSSTDGSGAPAFFDVGYKVDAASGAALKHILRFQPFCPQEDDLSDAGLAPDTAYELRLPGQDTSPLTLQSLLGASLELTQVVPFSTPPFTGDPRRSSPTR